MAKSSLVAGLDIGTGAIKIAIAQKKSGQEDLDIVHVGQQPSRGVRRGVVTDYEIVAKQIGEAVKSAELATGHEVQEVYVSVNGSHIFCTPSKGLVSVSRADGNISAEDVDRVLQAARTISLSSNKEIIDIYPREFAVDGEAGVKDAVGMKGVRLEAEVLIMAGFTPYLKNSDQAVLRSGLEVANRAPAVIASAAAAMSGQEKELGAAILDIGAGTAGLAVYEEGDLLHAAVLPIGSANITHDIAIGMKVDVDAAERLKIEKGVCVFKGADKKIKLAVDGDKTGGAVLSQKTLSKIIQERVSEIFDLANKELKKIGRDKKLPAGIILAGGGVKLAGIEELAKKTFQLTCSIGAPRNFSNIDRDPSLAAVCGLALAGWKEREDEVSGSPRFSVGGLGKIKKFFKIFIP